MNERIKELGTRAGLYMESTMPGGFPNEQLINAEKFAELIIQECVDTILQDQDRYRKEYFADLIVKRFSDAQEREERLRSRSTYFGNE